MFWKHCAFRVFKICDVLLAYFSFSCALKLLLWIFSITDFTVAWYIVLFCKHLAVKGHSFFTLQVKVGLICACAFLGDFFFVPFYYLSCSWCKYTWFLLFFFCCGECLMGEGFAMSLINSFLHLFYFCLHGGRTIWCFFFCLRFH